MLDNTVCEDGCAFQTRVFFVPRSEQEAKFVQDRITGVEKHFAELCTIFAAFTRKTARCASSPDDEDDDDDYNDKGHMLSRINVFPAGAFEGLSRFYLGINFISVARLPF